MDRYERRLIAQGLAQCDGCKLGTSRLLDIAPNTLRKKIKRYGLAAGDDASNARGEERQTLAVSRLRAYSSWAELKKLPAAQQIERIKDVPSHQTREMFDLVVAAASNVALEDPFRGEETALVAQALACILPSSACSERLRHDLLGEVLRVIGNCRRLTGDWPGSAAALDAARSHLEEGTGEPVRQARLLSIQASLASDTGNLEEARALLARAAVIYRREQNLAAVASIRVQEANTLVAAGRHEEAMTCAQKALRGLTPREARLEMLARSILTECLAFLRQPTEALQPRRHLALVRAVPGAPQRAEVELCGSSRARCLELSAGSGGGVSPLYRGLHGGRALQGRLPDHADAVRIAVPAGGVGPGGAGL